MLIIDYHCPYQSVFLEVVAELKEFNEKKNIVNCLSLNKKYTIKYYTKLNYKLLTKLYMDLYVKG